MASKQKKPTAIKHTYRYNHPRVVSLIMYLILATNTTRSRHDRRSRSYLWTFDAEVQVYVISSGAAADLELDPIRNKSRSMGHRVFEVINSYKFTKYQQIFKIILLTQSAAKLAVHSSDHNKLETFRRSSLQCLKTRRSSTKTRF